MGTPQGQSYLHTLKLTYFFQILPKILWHKFVWLDTKGQSLWAEQLEFAPLTMIELISYSSTADRYDPEFEHNLSERIDTQQM